MSDAAAALSRLLAIMDELRDPQHGCPWDLEQDFASVAPHTLEEVYEVIDAIEQRDYAQLQGELGDLLFQVVFYARLGSEQGLFDFASIAEAIGSKLLQRHPHVFPDATLESAGRPSEISAGQVAGNWERIKQQERQRGSEAPVSVLDDVPAALPALLRAAKLQKRAATRGFDWPDRSGVLAKLGEEIGELEQALESGDEAAVADEFGDLLFTIVNLGRHLELNSESALRAANRKFERRFRAMEKQVLADGQELGELDLETMEKYWQGVKREGG